jgi:hypothetical protein
MAAPLIQQTLVTGQTSSGVTALFPNSLSGQYIEYTVYVTFDHTSAAGTVVLETAPDQAYAGTWANIGTVTWSAIDKCHYVSVTGVFNALRVRISSAVTSGTCDVFLVASAN